MHKYDESLDFLYLDYEKLLKVALVFGAFFAIFSIAFSSFPSEVLYLINIIIIMICFGLMIVLYTTTEFSNSRNIVCSFIVFLSIGLTSIMDITLQISSNSSTILNNIIIQNIDLYTLSESIYIMLSVFTLRKKYNNKWQTLIYVPTMLLAMAVFVLMMEYGIFINSLKYIIQVVNITFMIVALISIRRLNFRVKDELNYFIIFVYIMLASFVFHLIYNVTGSSFSCFIFTILRLGSYLIISVALFNKFINRPYNTIFNDIYWQNIQLEEFNKRVYLKNMTMIKMRESIEKKENDYKKLFEGMPLPMVIINKKSRRIMFANMEFLKIFGIQSLRKVINKSINSLIYINENTIVYGEEDTIYDGISEIEDEIANFEIREICINDNKEDSILILSNVTEKMKFENMKESINQKKLEEKMRRNFLSTISHDLKTPINVIYSATQLSKYLLENDNFDSIKKYNLTNKDNCMTLIRLTNNIIDTSKIDFGYLKPELIKNNIVEIIEETIEHLVEYAKDKNLDLIFDTEEEEIFVLCDRNFMERIILNIISNSIKYSDRGEIKVNIKCNDVDVIVEVADQGIGINSKYMESAFGRFNSKDKSRITTNQSTGLGLYVVKNLVELQGGQVFIESRENRGTKVIIKFIRELE